MARHGFGRGEYKYFRYPLPGLVARMRTALYPRLAPLANRWNSSLGLEARFPDGHAQFLRRCHAAGDYDCLHQDLYVEHVFPLQLTVLLSGPGRDFAGGEFVLTEQRPRMQSRAEVRHRPVRGSRGVYRVNLRHGVSRVRWGQRHTLGIVCHDAR